MPLVPGKTLTHFVVLDILGAGAMGEVYRAKDTRLDREVAIKLLPEHFAKDAERRKRFEREAKSLASLNHPNIAQIYAVDQDEDSYFLALELVPGETVEDRLRRGPLPLDEALDIGRQIAEGLEAAHEAGVIHRDLKPANIRVTPEGKVKLLDFGLAKPVREGAGTSSSDSVLSTEQGRLLGTPTYMAPEQARGRAIDKRVDLWAFGCVLYECLTARRAFGGETLSDVIANVIENEPDWSRLPPLPTRVRELIERCLTKDLAHRQRGAGDAALALEVARREGPSLRAAAPRRAGATVGWLVAAVACATAVWLQLRSGSEPSRAVATARETRFELALPPDTRLCPSDRANNEVAVSADGTRIAYVVEDGENTAIWTRALGQLEPKRLDLGKDVRGPTFSPDGKWMAYTQGFRHLMRVPVDGGPPERMVTLRFTKDAAWLADGTWACADQDQLHILECDLALGTTRVLATAAAGFEGFENVVASPDPSWLLADGWKGLGVTDYRVFAVDRASGAVEVLIENAASPAVVGEDILVFQRGAALYATRFDFRTRRPLGEPRMVQAGVSTDRWGGSTQFAVSRTGTLVYAPGSRRGEGRRLVWKSADGSVEPIRAEPDAFSQGLDLSVAGRMVIVRTLRDREQLWSIDLIGKSMAPVVAGELTCAVLTSQGDAVVYCIRTAVGYELRHAPLNGGTPRLLLRANLRPWSLSQDGRYLLASGRQEGQQQGEDIFALDLSQEPPSRSSWLATPATETDAHFSPDGKWVAYASDRAGRLEVFVRAWPAGQRDWKVSKAGGGTPRWAPDGRMLYYVDSTRLMAAAVEFDSGSGEPGVQAGPARELFSDLAFAELDQFSVGADGRILMVQLADWELAANRLRVVTHWQESLERALAPPR